MRHFNERLPEDTVLWRYMEPMRVVSMLDESRMYFASASEFQDKFEGSVFVEPPSIVRDERDKVAAMMDNAFKKLTQYMKISCWHIADFESDAMWKLYASEGRGIAIRTTLARLVDSLRPFRVSERSVPEEPYCGRVRYVDLVRERVDARWEGRFFVKHRVFEWEREFRMLFSVRSAAEFGMPFPEEGIKVEYDPKTLLADVVAGPTLSDHDRAEVEAACERAGLNSRLQVSSTLGNPRFA